MKRLSHLPPAAPRGTSISDRTKKKSGERATKASVERVNITEENIRAIDIRRAITDAQLIATDTCTAAGKGEKERSDEKSPVDDVRLGKPLDPTTEQPE